MKAKGRLKGSHKGEYGTIKNVRQRLFDISLPWCPIIDRLIMMLIGTTNLKAHMDNCIKPKTITTNVQLSPL